MNILEAKEDDIKDIFYIMQSVYEGLSNKEYYVYPEITSIKEYVDNGGFILKIVEKNRIIGTMIVTGIIKNGDLIKKINLDRKDLVCEILNVAILEEYRGNKLSSKMLKIAEEKIKKTYSENTIKLIATVHPNNLASLKSFIKNGYEIVDKIVMYNGKERLVVVKEIENNIQERKTRLEQIRENEKKSHTEIYNNEKLYNTNSWLKKPIKTVQDILPLFNGYTKLRVLDLGCGVGRNSIYIAEKFKNINCTIDCVDLLDVAIDKLNQYSIEYDVDTKINGIVKPIEEYEIKNNTYDIIMAVSALEHVDNEKSFVKKLEEIKNGLRKDGIVCLVINTNAREFNIQTNERLEAQFEINLPTHQIQMYLDNIFSQWDVLKNIVKEQEYQIPRDKIVSKLTTSVMTFVARKK